MNATPRTKLVVIVGPTAVGKTNLAVRIAQEVACEVVSADSRQIYRGMDIGTAKPTPEERLNIRHHLIDIVAPDQILALPQYITLAGQAITDIAGRGMLPLLVGGTGQYIRALLEGWAVPRVEADATLRAELESYAEQEGPQALHKRLEAVDALAASRIDYRNVRRVVRALEVYYTLGQPITALQAKQGSPYDTLIIGLTLPREDLYDKADLRIEQMLASGFVTEVAGLVKQGYAFDLPAMSGLGYQQIGAYLRGEIALDEAVLLIKRSTRRFIRHQYNWFRLNDPHIRWFQADNTAPAAIIEAIKRFNAS
ncbi:MAG: tRNA (adenosine(37)-N6)-dimethylallyltransferase MiaA [Chloroflexi bacterium]|nr:tRNA (adenosine(37)-N6)-dimethylallyltransferase MiaA [Chloroflexota bacterium]